MHLRRITAAHDVGRAVNPTLIEGQIEGGVAQGIGMALMEEYVPGRNENLHDYLIPTIGDVPEVVSILVESGDPVGPYGAKGIGEHALVPTAPAILNAIRDAVGAGVRRVPATPDRVLAAIAGRSRGMTEPATDTVVCDACPIRCVIKPGRTGSCDRYGNVDGVLARMDPLLVLQRTQEHGGALVPFASREGDWEGELVPTGDVFVTGAGSGTTYPDYKPAPFIVSSTIAGVDMVTVVTEAIFSYCGVDVKIDTDRHVGAERQIVRAQGEAVGHVTTGQYGSQMLSLGGVNHLTGGTKHEGVVTMETLLALCSGDPVELSVDEGSQLILQAGEPPVINGVVEERMRVGCGSATMRHVRAAVVRTRRRGGGGRRPHHRRALGASGRPVPEHPRHRDQGQRPPVHAGAVLQRRQPGNRLGGNRYRGPAHDHRPVRPRGRATGAHVADDRHDRRAPRLLRAGRRPAAGAGARSPTTCACRSSGSARTASRP